MCPIFLRPIFSIVALALPHTVSLTKVPSTGRDRSISGESPHPSSPMSRLLLDTHFSNCVEQWWAIFGAQSLISFLKVCGLQYPLSPLTRSPISQGLFHCKMPLLAIPPWWGWVEPPTYPHLCGLTSGDNLQWNQPCKTPLLVTLQGREAFSDGGCLPPSDNAPKSCTPSPSWGGYHRSFAWLLC